MPSEIEGLAKNLADMANGKGGAGLEHVMKILASEKGRKIMSKLLSDGGGKVREAAEAAKNGNINGVMGLINAISNEEGGAELLGELMREIKK